MQRLASPAAPPVGPYSPAVRVGPWLFLSGQIALRPDGTLEKTSIEAETQQVLANLQALLEAAGAKPEQLVKVTIYLTDMAFLRQSMLFTRGSFRKGSTQPVKPSPSLLCPKAPEWNCLASPT